MFSQTNLLKFKRVLKNCIRSLNTTIRSNVNDKNIYQSMFFYIITQFYLLHQWMILRNLVNYLVNLKLVNYYISNIVTQQLKSKSELVWWARKR